ncbi:tyrosine-type recombinase/integrase [Cerasicoccus fimbriatus]|uniref:tyrosine-type recombinase/integrase n=1 Tax=Cerasicoccus fimbriatus TaxID=3014554 RepID=UPI0022B40132|nr:hypothetical protein [Cerasicoccus sp. TK19100]
MNSKPFKVKTFKYPSGNKGYLLSGTIDGRQVRKKFQSKDEAYAERSTYELRRQNSEVKLHTVPSKLNEDQHKEAYAAYQLLDGTGKSLTEAVSFFLEHNHHDLVHKPLSEAVDAYLLVRFEEKNRGTLSAIHYRNTEVELNRLKAHFTDKNIGDITDLDLGDYIGRDSALKTWNNRRSYLRKLWQYFIDEKWAGANPTDKLKHYGKREVNRNKGEASTLTASEAAKLMEYVQSYKDGVMVPHIALCLFAGIRPDYNHGEITKLQPEHISMEGGRIHVPASVSKVDEKRMVDIQPNLKAWLERFPPKHYPILPGNCRRMRQHLAKRFELGKDIMRHTFCSMLLAKTGDVGRVSLQAGNSTDVIRDHYLDVKTEEEAAEFWNILPTKGNKIISISA